MAVSCFNINSKEYQALATAYPERLQRDSIINKWQTLNKSEEFPTVQEAKLFVKNQKTAFSLKKRKFGEAVLANLSRLKLISKFKGAYYVNNSNRVTREYDAPTLAKNLAAVQRYLSFKNIPQAAVEIVRTKNSYMIDIDHTLFTKRDIIEESRDNNGTHTADVIQHLGNMFPQVDIRVASVGEAEAYYDSLPTWQKAQVPFNKVKSYYVDGQVVLIEGRMTTETAIEEVLHPFVDAIYVDNKSLFNNLLSEAKVNFPELTAQIDDSYSELRGFTKQDRDLELVTQALSRHFKKEHESGPTNKWNTLITKLLNWLKNIVNDLHSVLTGKNLSVSKIDKNTSMSDIARLLNTEDLTFKIDRVPNKKVRYKLTDELQSIVDHAKTTAQNQLQRDIIDKMFHTATLSPTKVKSLVATGAASDPIIILNEADHVYRDLMTGQEYYSATKSIKGTMPEENKKQHQLNIDIGNDFDRIAEGIAGGLTFNEVLPDLKIIGDSVRDVIVNVGGKKVAMPASVSREAYATLQGYISGLKMNGAVVIPQVVLANQKEMVIDGVKYGGIAGKADLLIIQPNGEMGIIDLKTSINSIHSNKYDLQYPLEAGSLLFDKVDGNTLSTRQQHSIQVNLYRRLLENMGYKMMDPQSQGVSTFHILVRTSGKGAEQKFENSFEVQDHVNHPPSQNQVYVDKILPLDVNEDSKAQVLQIIKDDGMDNPTLDVDPKIDAPENTEYTPAMYDVIFKQLTDLKIGLIQRQEALEMTKGAITSDKTREESMDYIVSMISGINVALMTGAKATSKEFTKILQMTNREIENFIDYVKDADNFTKPEYISYVLNFEKFLETYRGLTTIKDAAVLNKSQNALLVRLLTNLNKISGSKKEEGMITIAIQNFTRSLVKENTNNVDMTAHELDMLMKKADDIGLMEYNTYDMSTSSDTLLALMDKIYKRKRQETLDKIDRRNNEIIHYAQALEKNSPGGKADYSFMLQFDADGNFTGRYVQKIGYTYWKKRYDIRQPLFDEEGKWKEYIYIENLADARPEDIEYNKKLHAARAKNREFLSAENRTENGYSDGEYHAYTREFKDERAKYEVYIKTEKGGYWERKKGVSDIAWQRYRARNYVSRQVHISKYDNKGQFTGQTYIAEREFVKNKHKEIRELSARGEDMRDAKWVKIMNPTNSLEQAQKDFYEMFREQFEEELLKKLPMDTRDQMLGKAPLVQDNMDDTLTKRSNVVASLWAKGSRWVKNGFVRTSSMKRVMVDEDGQFVDTLPIFYVGNPRSEAALGKIYDELKELDKRWRQRTINKDEYDLKQAELQGKAQRLRNQPSLNEISQDMGDSLLRFSAMAEQYETMGEIQDTLKAMIKTIENRKYQPDAATTMVATVKGKLEEVGIKGLDFDSNTVKRAKKWMKMVYYNNDKQTRGWWDKAVSHLINYSSLSYVAFNVFGNINNYAIARINNSIETAGGRFYKSKAMMRAVKEFNLRALPDLMRATAFLGDRSAYKKYRPESKWEAMVEHFRMMDQKGDIREGGPGSGKGRESWLQRKLQWGYLLQDAGEYNVQTKVGMAILMSRQIRKGGPGGETLALYDAYTLNGDGTVTLKEGFDTLVDDQGNEIKKWDEKTTRYDLRNEIREVNKQIHGNYAYEDRMVIQSHSLGQLAAQFHKWVVPAIKARYRKEYFDENVGWLEGRYLSFLGFMKYAVTNFSEINQWASGYKKQFSKVDADGNLIGEEFSTRAEMKMLNVYRTLGEIGIMLTTVASAALLQMLFEDDEDDSDTVRRLENALIYQADRSYKEMIQFIPIPGLGGLRQMFQMVGSPIAATRTLGEVGEAMSKTMITGTAWLTQDEKEFYQNSDVTYQRKPKKGQLKMSKEWKDAIPILYSIQRYYSFDKEKDFYIK